MAKQTFTTGQVLTAAQMTSLQQTAMGGGSTTAKTVSYVLVAADAGTVVQMNAAGATTITVNTALFAAGDTVQIQNVGAGVCTITAGTATVNTSATLALKQYDAGTLYFNSTSAAIFFAVDAADSTSPLTTKGDLYGFSTLDARIPIGTNNQVLTADSTQALGLKWATPSTGATFVGVRAITSSASIVYVSGADNAIPYAAEDYDTNTFHDNTTNNSRITIPTGYGGKYLLTGQLEIGNAVTSYLQLRLYKNGSLLNAQLGRLFNWSAAGNPMIAGATCLALVAGDYVQLMATASDNFTSNTYSSFTATYLGA